MENVWKMYGNSWKHQQLEHLTCNVFKFIVHIIIILEKYLYIKHTYIGGYSIYFLTESFPLKDDAIFIFVFFIFCFKHFT